MHRPPRILRAGAVAVAIATVLALASPVASGLAVSPATAPARADAGGEADVERPRRARSARVVADRPDAARRAPTGELLVEIPAGGLVARRSPRATAPSVGRVVDRSRYYGVPTVAWIERTSADGRWGRVELPYVWPRRDGWVRLDGLRTDTTAVTVEVDLSSRRLTLRKRGKVVFRAPVATGRASSPTPRGEYFVTDRVSFSGGVFGTFAFGLSGIQPRLPVGWSSGDQLAIHGTNAPSSIGTAASAGCLRASEATLARLKPLLRLGTPVVIVA